MSFADFTDRYGLHSLRSGGATLVAKEDVPDHIFHARIHQEAYCQEIASYQLNHLFNNIYDGDIKGFVFST